jgi:hypothetical protein
VPDGIPATACGGLLKGMRLILIRIATLTAVLGCVPAVYTGGPAGPTTPSINSGDQLVSAMRNRYSRWYNTLTFVQKSTYYRTDGSVLRTETWYEAAKFPGRLRIDIGEPSRGTGALYRSDSIYQVQSGRITARRVEINPLMTLGFDVYAQSPSTTSRQLRYHGINMSVIRRDTLDGRRVWVVGAAKGDSTTNQFWVDAERLLFVRLVQTQNGRLVDVRFERYTQYEGGWVAEDVRIYSGGRMTFHEEYSRVRVNDDLDDDLFIPERWSSARHWYRP